MGAKTAGFAMLGAYLDKRELQAALPDRSPLAPTPQSSTPAPSGFVPTLDRRGEPELWFAFGADTGEDDDATRAFVRGLHRPPDGEATTSFIVLGGDQVYPAPDRQGYEDRLGRPWTDAVGEHAAPPTVLAIPGNHDWYDGLNAFLRTFAQGGHLLGTSSPLVQGRSYWTVALHGGWWVWGADIEFGQDIDAPQRTYFEQAAAALDPQDRVVLCVSKPFWYHRSREHQRSTAFLEALVERRGAKVAAMLTGDVHHYLHLRERTEGVPQHRITCGGGGAFAHATHHIAATREVRPSRRDRATLIGIGLDRDDRMLEPVGEVVPSIVESRRLVNRVLAFPVRNPEFTLLPSLLALLYLLAAITTPQVRFGRDADGDLAARSLAASFASLGDGFPATTLFLGSPAALGLDLALIGLLAAFAMPGPHNRPNRWLRSGRGLLHGLGWMTAIAICAWAVARIVGGRGGSWGAVPSAVATAALAGVACSTVMGAYLRLSWGMGKWNGNEVCSAVRDHRRIHLLHLHLHDGKLDVHPVVAEVPSSTMAPLDLRAIEPPFPLDTPMATDDALAVRP